MVVEEEDDSDVSLLVAMMMPVPEQDVIEAEVPESEQGETVDYLEGVTAVVTQVCHVRSLLFHQQVPL